MLIVVSIVLFWDVHSTCRMPQTSCDFICRFPSIKEGIDTTFVSMGTTPPPHPFQFGSMLVAVEIRLHLVLRNAWNILSLTHLPAGVTIGTDSFASSQIFVTLTALMIDRTSITWILEAAIVKKLLLCFRQQLLRQQSLLFA
jgi:hypothetical protein